MKSFVYIVLGSSLFVLPKFILPNNLGEALLGLWPIILAISITGIVLVSRGYANLFGYSTSSGEGDRQKRLLATLFVIVHFSAIFLLLRFL